MRLDKGRIFSAEYRGAIGALNEENFINLTALFCSTFNFCRTCSDAVPQPSIAYNSLLSNKLL